MNRNRKVDASYRIMSSDHFPVVAFSIVKVSGGFAVVSVNRGLGGYLSVMR